MKSGWWLGALLMGMVACSYPEVPYIPSVPVINPEDPTVRLAINGKLTTQSLSWFTSTDSSGYLLHFDRRSYPQASSIRFLANFRTTDPTNFAHVRLYNLSQHTPIPGTELRHNEQGLHEALSENILHLLPYAPVTLAIQIRSELGAEVATGWRSHLIIEE